MAFWSNAVVEPKRNFRWVASIPRFNGEFKFVLKKFKKPSFEIKATEHMYLNHKFNYPGRLNWKEVEMTVVNASNSQIEGGGAFDTVKTFMDVIKNAGYQLPSDVNVSSNLSTISKNKMTSNLGIITISQLGPAGNDKFPLEQWAIYNPMISGMTMSDLDYSNEDLSDVTVTIVYDYAKLILPE